MIRLCSKPVIVEAVRVDQDLAPLDELAPGKVRFDVDGVLELLAGVDGAQGWVKVPRGHWLVRSPGDPSDVWPVEEEVLERRYEEVAP